MDRIISGKIPCRAVNVNQVLSGTSEFIFSLTSSVTKVESSLRTPSCLLRTTDTISSHPLRVLQLLLNPLAPSDPYMGRTAQLTSGRCILNTYATNIRTEYFKCAA
jgi:hypothetical protein